ncbi:hypothetical protein E2C01_096382 [Portunus trituberculatus]|uniref:Uncharacterized protein n=1 Tax=Portunus trituberculatus TaxID=210409 RepID=A0A5B7K2U9_PORTR|nr:hypothetical protein [Portunus trituberculatus]
MPAGGNELRDQGFKAARLTVHTSCKEAQVMSCDRCAVKTCYCSGRGKALMPALGRRRQTKPHNSSLQTKFKLTS